MFEFVITVAFLVFRRMVKPWNRKLFAVIAAVLLQTKLLTMVMLVKSATWKSCSGSTSDVIAIMGEKAICSTKKNYCETMLGH
jgi:hypothetical protein